VNLLLLNIVFAVLWMFMWGQFGIYVLLLGFILGYLLLGIISRASDQGAGYGSRGWRILSFSLYFIRILIKANLVVAWEILTPGFNMTPRFIRYPVEGMSPMQVTSLANGITLTPGTLSADISEDGRWLYVHCMYAKDRQQAIDELDELRDRMIKDLFT